jgi:hypothetical protein
MSKFNNADLKMKNANLQLSVGRVGLNLVDHLRQDFGLLGSI